MDTPDNISAESGRRFSIHLTGFTSPFGTTLRNPPCFWESMG